MKLNSDEVGVNLDQYLPVASKFCAICNENEFSSNEIKEHQRTETCQRCGLSLEYSSQLINVIVLVF